MGPRDIESTTHDDGDTGTRRMFDKRTLRRMYRAHFDVAIQTYRSGEQHRAVQVLPPSGTAVYLRKRPLFEKEAEDFDVITALPQGTVLHDCKLKADLKSPYIVHRTFPLPCFSELMSNDDVCNGINLPRLLQRAIDGEHVTCCMFGQTGSGKSHTMSGILAQAATLLFANAGLQRPVGMEAQLSCFEVCGSNCFDLLQDGEKLVVRENANTKVEVSAKQVVVESSDSVLSQLYAASHNRSTSSTLRNMDSSRSHAFYRITMFCQEPIPPNGGATTQSRNTTATVGGGSRATKSTPQSSTRTSMTGLPLRATAGGARSSTAHAARSPAQTASHSTSARKPATTSSSVGTSSSAKRGARPTASAQRTVPHGGGPRGGAAAPPSSTTPGAPRTRPAGASATPVTTQPHNGGTMSRGPAAKKGEGPTNGAAPARTPARGTSATRTTASTSASTKGAPPPSSQQPATRTQRLAALAAGAVRRTTGSGGGGSSSRGTAAATRVTAPPPSLSPITTVVAPPPAAPAPAPSPHMLEEGNDNGTPLVEDESTIIIDFPMHSVSGATTPATAVASRLASMDLDTEHHSFQIPHPPPTTGCTECIAPPSAPRNPSRSTPATPAMRTLPPSPLAPGRGFSSTPCTPAASHHAAGGEQHGRSSSGGDHVLTTMRSSQHMEMVPMQRVERGTITFVDLAGSERAWDSMYHNAEQRKQTAEINASLSCLKECFRVRSLQMQALAARGGSTNTNTSLRVPYRDSRLTLLLRDSLQSTSSTEPCVVVVATLSPCAGDTEHTLNTLRNAVTMTGMDINHLNKGESAQEEGIYVDTGADQVVKHPSRWDVEECRQWMSSVAGGKFASAAENLTSATDGKAMMRFAPVRFKLLCDGNAKMGGELYKLYKEELRVANESKSKYQDGIRNLSTAPNIFA